MSPIAATLLLLPRLSALMIPLEAPPVLNSPVFSLATINGDGSTNMNILTYATPVGIQPRTWAISLYRKTASHANFVSQRAGVLQLLCAPHASLVYPLGGKSGADTNKEAACAAAGFPWLALPTGERLLPQCTSYLRLVQVGELVNAGEHDVAICRVEEMFAEDGPCAAAPLSTACEKPLCTAALRDAGLITDRGRAVEPYTGAC